MWDCWTGGLRTDLSCPNPSAHLGKHNLTAFCSFLQQTISQLSPRYESKCPGMWLQEKLQDLMCELLFHSFSLCACVCEWVQPHECLQEKDCPNLRHYHNWPLSVATGYSLHFRVFLFRTAIHVLIKFCTILFVLALRTLHLGFRGLLCFTTNVHLLPFPWTKRPARLHKHFYCFYIQNI